jgi:serine/threonine protein kinase
LAIDHSDEDRPVALKFMRNASEYQREIEARQKGDFSDEYVIGILRSHSADEDPAFAAALARKDLEDLPYCIVMKAGERTLADIISREHICGSVEQTRSICAEIAKAVGYMHSRGYMHGDLKRKYQYLLCTHSRTEGPLLPPSIVYDMYCDRLVSFTPNMLILLCCAVSILFLCAPQR